MNRKDNSAAQTESTNEFQADGVLALSAGHALHDTYTAFLPPLLPEFIEKFALSNTQAGLLSVFMQIPSLLQPFIGHLSDHLSLRYLVILAPTVTAVMMSLLGAAPSYILIALALFIVGISSASLHAIGPVMVGNLSGGELGRGMGVWMVGGELGRTLGPIVIVSAVAKLTLEGTWWLMVGGVAASVMLYVRLKSIAGRPPNAGQGLPWRQALRLMGPLLLPLVGIIIIRSFMSAALTTYLPTFMREQGRDLQILGQTLSVREFSGLSLSVLESAGVVGALCGGWLSDRLGRRPILLISMLLTPLLMFVFLAVSDWVQIPVLLALGFTALSITPVIMALVQESFPDNRALANGTFMALSFVIRSGAVLALGAMGDFNGLRAAFMVSAAIPLLGAPLVLCLPDP